MQTTLSAAPFSAPFLAPYTTPDPHLPRIPINPPTLNTSSATTIVLIRKQNIPLDRAKEGEHSHYKKAGYL